MTNKKFYRQIEQEVMENCPPEHQHIIVGLHITSLEQALGVFRAIMIENSRQGVEIKRMRRELNKLLDIVGVSEDQL